MSEPYILKMQPYLRKKIWGGRKLADVFHKKLPDASSYGEAWEVSDLAEGESTVQNGPLAGKLLSEVVSLWGTALTGADGGGSLAGAFPLLVKVLDAQDDLSVQVHPGKDDIEEHGLVAHSKDECWLILDADEDGCILHGFDEATTPADFRLAVEQNRAADALRRVPVAPGDVIRVSPGTIHAICKGVCLLEIQQPSDTTYRVYDYNRPGMDGNPRDLHLEEAMLVSNFDAHPPAKINGSTSETNAAARILVDVPSYRIEHVSSFSQINWSVDGRSPQVLFCAGGRLTLAGANGSVELGFGETAVVPAGLGSIEMTGADGAEVVVAGVGGASLL
jgi:mannose-6-phosphate isomerase